MNGKLIGLGLVKSMTALGKIKGVKMLNIKQKNTDKIAGVETWT